MSATRHCPLVASEQGGQKGSAQLPSPTLNFCYHQKKADTGELTNLVKDLHSSFSSAQTAEEVLSEVAKGS